MLTSNLTELSTIQSAIEGHLEATARDRISLRVRQDFDKYAAIRRAHGDLHLNQAFDPRFTLFTDRDFWIMAGDRQGQPIGTYCVRNLLIQNFYSLVRSQSLWFGGRPRPDDPTFNPNCKIPPFGGHVLHGGGLWIRRDHRGSSRLAHILPRLGRAIALQNWPLDYDTGMIRDNPGDSERMSDRKASFMGKRIYGFARVCQLVHGWFPPEGRQATVHLCHSTRVEAVASLAASSLQPERASYCISSPNSRSFISARMWSTRRPSLASGKSNLAYE